MALEWLKRKFRKSPIRMFKHEDSADLVDVIKKSKKCLKDPVLIANNVAYRQRTRIKKGLASTEEAVAEVLIFCFKNKSTKSKHKLLTTLLLELISIAADHNYKRRAGVRAIVSLLHRVSCEENGAMVHRGVYFFEYANVVVPLGERQALRDKMFYVMNMLAGVEIPKSVFGNKPTGFGQFIDLPLTPYHPFADNSLLSEAIYRLQDEKIMLQALRCGAFAPGILLWPIGMVLDLHRALGDPLDFEGKESLIIRYFCRSRRWIWLGLMPANYTRPIGVQFPEDIPRDDILLLPESAYTLVPEDRYKEAACLKHQCRLAIRHSLLKADQLPDGPKQLPLPKVLIRYVDLYED